MAKAVKRAYDGARRQEQAEELRRRIVDTAKPLFLANGYENTSMRQLADAAGVSLQTIYNAFDSKFGLFSRLVEVTVAGDHEPLAMAERDDMRTLRSITDADAFVEELVAQATRILGRFREVYVITRDALSDPQMAAAYKANTIEARYTDMRNLADALMHTKGVAASVTVERAADVIWAVLSPELYDLMRTHRGWSDDDFVAWATQTLRASLLA